MTSEIKVGTSSPCRCIQCEKPIPYKANRCNHCFAFNGNGYSRITVPPTDMYLNEVHVCEVDNAKVDARDLYLLSLSKTQNFITRKNEVVEKDKKENKFLLPIALGFILLFILWMFAPSSAFTVMFTVIFVVSTIFFILYSSLTNKHTNEYKKIEDDAELHKVKKAYYYSDKVFGFTKTNRVDMKDYKESALSHHEVDKSNIKEIFYDTENAEYVLFLYKPVYLDYRSEPTMVFRIQDVFDEEVLTVALGIDLPARDVPF